MQNNIEKEIDIILVEYAKSNPKRKIGFLPRILARILSLLPLELLIQIVQAKKK